MKFVIHGPNRNSTVRIDGVDGSHTGVAINLLHATRTGDADLQETVVTTVPAEEAFASCVELLLMFAHIEAETSRVCDSEPCDGGRRFLLHLAHSPNAEPVSALCHQLAARLGRNPDSQRFAVTPVPVLLLVDVLDSVAQFLEETHEVSLEDLLASLRVHVLDTRARECSN